MNSTKPRVIVITGAAAGVGRPIAQMFAQTEGALSVLSPGAWKLLKELSAMWSRWAEKPSSSSATLQTLMVSGRRRASRTGVGTD